MKKAISTALIAAILATGLQANETVLDSNQTVTVQEVTLETIMASPDNPNAQITPPEVIEQPKKEGPGIGMQILAAAATPVYIAGAVVTAIIISPVWLVKKAFGK